MIKVHTFSQQTSFFIAIRKAYQVELARQPTSKIQTFSDLCHFKILFFLIQYELCIDDVKQAYKTVAKSS